MGEFGTMDRVESAKRIKQVLRRAFPGVVFSVRLHRYSLGNTINIRWTDGPTSAQVDALVKPFERVARDETGDILCGGNSYVSTHRRESPEAMEKARQVRDQQVKGPGFSDFDWERRVFEIWAETSFPAPVEA